jgi:hypothetical protein
LVSDSDTTDPLGEEGAVGISEVDGNPLLESIELFIDAALDEEFVSDDFEPVVK